MIDKERLVLTGLLGVYLGPVLDKLLVPPADQQQLYGLMIMAVPVIWHYVAAWAPRILYRWFPMDRLFPPIPTTPANPANLEKP